MSAPANYSPERMRADKRAYGALDGDFAKRCHQCNERFAGSATRCPRCDTPLGATGTQHKEATA